MSLSSDVVHEEIVAWPTGDEAQFKVLFGPDWVRLTQDSRASKPEEFLYVLSVCRNHAASLRLVGSDQMGFESSSFCCAVRSRN